MKYRPSRRDFLKLAGSLAPGLAFGPPSPLQRTPQIRRASSVMAALQANGGSTRLNLEGLNRLLYPRQSVRAGENPRTAVDRIEAVVTEPLRPTTIASRLRLRHANLKRHFAFEYYPWYRTNPWEHWGQFDRMPPIDAATTMMPMLGAYDSQSTQVIEQHASWIAAAGVGTVNLSWWGPGSSTDQVTHRVMDIMKAHDIHVAFHIEPYADAHGSRFAEDIAYLIREYGERRRWDAFLLLDRPGRVAGPVFKLFRSIVPPTSTDCLGRTTAVPDYTPDAVWREQITQSRQMFQQDFPITFLADSLDLGRTEASGFDGIAIYDNFVTPDLWPTIEAAFRSKGLVSSFNINAGFDAIEPRGPQGPCYVPLPLAPPVGPVNWELESERARIAAANDDRIASTLLTTTSLQMADQSTNWRTGFFMVYINSFNEWHEGSAFEPPKNWADLSAAERAVGYHNPTDGMRRLRTLQTQLAPFR